MNFPGSQLQDSEQVLVEREMEQQIKVGQEGGAETWTVEKQKKVKVWWHRVPYINFLR